MEARALEHSKEP